MGWYLARSLDKLRSQLNAMFPNRDKKSDGTVGDTAHSARKSSHNPNANGAVRAFDVTHNPEQGIDCRKLLAALLKTKDRRLWYVIFNAKIYNAKDGFAPRPYSGLNAHKHHLHISVSDSSRLYDDMTEWELGFPSADSSEPITPAPEPAVATEFVGIIKLGDRNVRVKELQLKLYYLGLLTAKDVDGIFGKGTEAAVKQFQKSKGLDADGKVGKLTAAAMVR